MDNKSRMTSKKFIRLDTMEFYHMSDGFLFSVPLGNQFDVPAMKDKIFIENDLYVVNNKTYDYAQGTIKIFVSDFSS